MNLTEYLSNGIETIIKDAMKISFRNPKERAFLIKYVRTAKKAAKLREHADNKGERIPPFLIASITGECNISCAGCYAKANMPCGQSEMDTSEWERIFNEANELGVSAILLAGGEPFMRLDVIKLAAKSPLLFPIFTNGTMLKEYIPLLDSYRNLLPVLSIEGDEIMTDARRGTGVHKKITEVMQGLNEKGILFGTSITVTTENLEFVTSFDFIEDLYRKGCKVVFYIEYVPVELKPLALNDEKRAVFEERLENLRKMEMIFISFPGDEKEMDGCLAAGRGFFHIAANGNAEPCPFSPYSDTNLRNLPLREALKSPLFARLKSSDILNKTHTGSCVLFENEEAVQRLTCELEIKLD